MTLDVYDVIGDFENINPENVKSFNKIYPPTLHVSADIVVGTHDILIDYTDSEGT